MVEEEILQLIANNNLTDPCDPTKRAAELLEKALNGYCYAKIGNEPLNLEDAKHFMGEILEGGEWITSQLGYCPKAQCMYQRIQEITDNLICQYIEEIDEDKNYIVYLNTGDIFNETGAYGSTSIAENSNEITITFDFEKICNSNSPIIVAETILHEFLHAEFYVEMLKLGWDGSELNKSYYWDMYLQNIISLTGKTAHEVIAEYYLDPICKALWKLNGKKGLKTDYRGYVLNGVFDPDENGNTNNPFLKKYNITYEDVIEAIATSKSVVPEIPELNFNCK